MPRFSCVCACMRAAQTLEWCMQLGLEAVTVYAFSIENFKRPPAEVDMLMALAKEKLHMLSQQR